MKKTQKEMFLHIMETMADDTEVVEFCQHKLDILGKPRPKKVNQEAIDFAKAVATFLSDDDSKAFTCGQIAEALGESTGRVSAALRRLVGEETVVAVQSVKKSGKTTYVLA